jgi:hypothetical protein
MRTPIQIAALRFTRPSVTGEGADSIHTEIVALCDDGTIWTMFGTGNEWVPLPKIPQGPMLDDWLLDVKSKLLANHFVKPSAVDQLVEDHRSILVGKYNDDATATEAAKLIADLLEK